MAFNNTIFEQLVSSSTQGIVLVNQQGKIVFTNEAFCLLLQFHQLEVLNKQLEVFIADEFKYDFISCVQQKTSKSQHFVRFKTSTEKFVDASCNIKKVEDNGAELCALFVNDLSIQNHQQQNLIELNNKLKDFAFQVSHNLRNPIANILGLVELFNTNDPTDTENKIIVDGLTTSAKTLNDIVINLNATLSKSKLYSDIEVFNTPKQVESIMLVDDDLISNYINKSLIKKLNKNITTIDFISGKEAIAYLKGKSVKPDIIMLDLTMPIMNGWEFIEEFKKLDLNIKLLILTTSLETRDFERSKSYGLNVEFISKPLTIEVLTHLLNNMFLTN